jgi:GGDEF domain-containing protein
MDQLGEALATEQHKLDTVLLRLAELRVANEELGELARTDALTSVPNRAAFDDHLARTIAAAGGVVKVQWAC